MLKVIAYLRRDGKAFVGKAYSRGMVQYPFFMSSILPEARQVIKDAALRSIACGKQHVGSGRHLHVLPILLIADVRAYIYQFAFGGYDGG